MPTLHWIGKDKVVNHHLEVPYRILKKQYTFGDVEKSENKIIHGDNLDALKSLLPEYEGKVKCIYIDPPYNTGKEGWIYNDNVTDPKLKKWLGDVVGKEGEDLTRHDKWLCMMYPRLKLLQKLLSEDGIIFISIDDNEYQCLRLILDEIFGRKNFITNFTWRTDGNIDNQAKLKINHEYILCYGKNSELFSFPQIVDPNIEDGSKIFNNEIVNTIVKNGPKNPISKIILPVGFPASFPDGVIKKRNDAFPYFSCDAVIKNGLLSNQVEIESGWSSKRILELFIENGMQPVEDSKEQMTSFYITENGAIENVKKRAVQSHVLSSLMNMGSTQSMSSELLQMGIKFDFPKPVTLIKYLISIINDKNCIVLDSFAGSGTTGHAVINLNKQDGGTRKFIMIEMGDYVDTITTNRIKKVMGGYGSIAGIGGNFEFLTLGNPLMTEDGLLSSEASLEDIRAYVCYTETGSRILDIPLVDHLYWLARSEDRDHYFYYERERITVLDREFLSSIQESQPYYTIWADQCHLSASFMKKEGITFRKIPRDIRNI